MPIVKTKEYGDIQVSDENKIVFKKPIFGFEHLIEYYLIVLNEPEQFSLLQSKDDENISFMLTQPRLFVSDYILDIDDIDAGLLAIEDHNDIIDYAIVTIPEKIEDITMNILGPIVINNKNNFAVQSISNTPHYNTKCRLFQKDIATIVELETI
ncbi:MAG: flagellar assembly protein FliW [Spirochaetota bacterium]|nr:flagellar assembly protein FliW [Spirochaetota bacterium]